MRVDILEESLMGRCGFGKKDNGRGLEFIEVGRGNFFSPVMN